METSPSGTGTTTTTTPKSATNGGGGVGPREKLPDPVPHFIIFHLPHFFGTLIALASEWIGLESAVTNLLAGGAKAGHHRYALFGLGLVALANLNSYLTGCVVCARLELGVKLPNLYADKSSSSSDENKNAVLFNCIQRGHQNFMEAFPQVIASSFFTAIIADRPNTAGLMLLVICVCRYYYAKGYISHDIGNRFPYFLIQQFTYCVGVGYAAWIALTLIGIGPLIHVDVDVDVAEAEAEAEQAVSEQ